MAIAREQFLSHGFRRTTMDAVAASAKISKQTLYAQYPSKGSLYTAVVRDWVGQGRDAMAPHVRALLDADDLKAALLRLAGALQTGILSEPVLKMRAMVAAEAGTHPETATDYMHRSWDSNINLLAGALAELSRSGALDIDDPAMAAEQFVWLAVGAPLNRLELTAAKDGYGPERLTQVAGQGVQTFLSRYARPEAVTA